MLLCNTYKLRSSVLHITKKEAVIMADNKELKPKSFRLNEETAEKFKEISVAIGGNQQETLSKLIEAYEFQSGKAVLTEKKSDIEQFEKYTSCLVRMYMGTLEDNQNLTETIRTEFDALLKSKESVIQDLQSQLTTAKQLKEEATSKAKVYTDENTRLNDVIDTLKKDYDTRLTDMETMLSDKDNLNKTLMDSCNDLKVKIAGMKEAVEQAEKLKRELEGLKKDYKRALDEKSELNRQLNQNQETISELKQHESDSLLLLKEQQQLKLEKAVLELEKQYQQQIQELKVEKQEEIDKYQQKYLDLLEQIQEQKATKEEN